MTRSSSRVVTLSASCVVAGVLSVAACTHTTDRVIEPAAAANASAPRPELSDAGLHPLGPIAIPVDANEDYRLVRSPEFGASVREVGYEAGALQGRPGSGGASGSGGSSGMAGNDRRPVAAGGNYF